MEPNPIVQLPRYPKENSIKYSSSNLLLTFLILWFFPGSLVVSIKKRKVKKNTNNVFYSLKNKLRPMLFFYDKVQSVSEICIISYLILSWFFLIKLFENLHFVFCIAVFGKEQFLYLYCCRRNICVESAKRKYTF